MRWYFLICTIVLLLCSISIRAQQADLVSKWLTPEKDTIEFFQTGKTLTGKQISSLNYPQNNNKIIAWELVAKTSRIFEGTVIDFRKNKTYKCQFIIDKDGTELEMKVQWFFLTYTENWTRVE